MTVVTLKVRHWRTVIYVAIMSVMMAALLVVVSFVAKSLKVGLSISQALVNSALPIAAAVLALFAMWGLYVLFVERPTAEAPDAIDAGRTRWKRMRLFCTILLVPEIIFFTTGLLYGLTRGQWDASHWPVVGVLCMMVASLVWYWVSPPPKRERLYALGTGDTSRVNDEREQMLTGKAAFTTLMIVIIVIGFGGSLYEAFITGNIPWRANIAVGMIFLIYKVSRWYWARKI